MKKIKIDIIAGFLGAGKTTFINKLLQEAYVGETVTLLENEFGEVGIDGDLLSGHALAVKELSNGCICCTLQGDFIDGIRELAETYRPDRILIEPTGIGRIGDIRQACNEAARSVPVALNTLLTIVDATLFTAMIEVSGAFYTQQIAEGDVIVLSAVQNLTADDMPLAEIVVKLRKLNTEAPIFSVPWQELDTLQVLQVAEEIAAAKHGRDDDHPDASHHHHHDNDGFSSSSVAIGGIWLERDIGRLAEGLRSGNFGTVFRAKGFFPGVNGMQKCDYVYGRMETRPVDYRGKGKFVVIGKNLKESDLKAFLEKRGSL